MMKGMAPENRALRTAKTEHVSVAQTLIFAPIPQSLKSTRKQRFTLVFGM